MEPPLSSFYLNLVLIFLEYFLMLAWILELAESEWLQIIVTFKKVVYFSNKCKVKQLHNCQTFVSFLHHPQRMVSFVTSNMSTPLSSMISLFMHEEWSDGEGSDVGEVFLSVKERTLTTLIFTLQWSEPRYRAIPSWRRDQEKFF